MSELSMAQQIAVAVRAFEKERTGHGPGSVTVLLSHDTLVITLHDALTPAEQVLARTPAGAAQVEEFHRQLFANACRALRQEIRRITGVDVRQAGAEVQPASGAVLKVFTTGTVVQVFSLAGSVQTDVWSDSGRQRGLDPASATSRRS